MGLKLIKTMDDGWPVYTLRREDNRRIATTRWPFDEPSLMIAKGAGIELQKLSHENCDEIFEVVDVQNLVNEEIILLPESTSIMEKLFTELGFKRGFNKSMELNKDKVFSVEDMKKACSLIFLALGDGGNITTDEVIQSFQQPNEIEVEIVMVKTPDAMFQFHDVPYSTPKLDLSGCFKRNVFKQA